MSWSIFILKNPTQIKHTVFVAAGLCRTCEIFGASALVLDSLRHVNDKNFQSLSVSAELWLPLLEVMCRK